GAWPPGAASELASGRGLAVRVDRIKAATTAVAPPAKRRRDWVRFMAAEGCSTGEGAVVSSSRLRQSAPSTWCTVVPDRLPSRHTTAGGDRPRDLRRTLPNRANPLARRGSPQCRRRWAGSRGGRLAHSFPLRFPHDAPAMHATAAPCSSELCVPTLSPRS